MKNPLRSVKAALVRWRGPKATHDAVTAAPHDEITVVLDVPAEDGGTVPVSFMLSELPTIASVDELRERAVEKGADLGARSTEAAAAPRAAIEHLISLGVREATERYEKEKGVTTVRFNAGRMLRARSGRSHDEGFDGRGTQAGDGV